VEANLGFTRYSFDVEQDKIVYDALGRVIDQRRVQRDDLEPDPLNLVSASVALVGDYSFFGFTSPIRGGRYRLELEATRGTADYYTLTADYRRYFSPSKDLTFAVRGLHYGRYGYGEDLTNNSFLRPLFLGYETLIRGYSWESLQSRECGDAIEEGICPVFDRLFGQRIGVLNFELRVPFIGTEQLGIIDLPYVPMELIAFTDVGVAWDKENPVDDWGFKRTSQERVPLWSTGVGARFNILGFMILEAYYAYPWQRPDKGAHWGFNLAPGW
jgi:outer membrane protein assembly factor BamA